MLTGNSIYDLETITTIQPGDLFLISQPTIYQRIKYDSNKMKLSALVGYMSADVMSHFGTMIYENASDYCLTSHLHNDKYNYFGTNGITYYFPVDKTNDISIGQFFVDGLLSTLYMPLSASQSRTYIIKADNVKPKIGSVKYSVIGSIDPDTGWVLADGSTYSLADYKSSAELAEVYGSSGTEFTVPELTNFTKLDHTAILSYPSTGDQHVYTPDHQAQHNVSLTINGTVEISAEILCSKSEGSGIYAHNGGTYDSTHKKVNSGSFSVTIKPSTFSITGLTINSASTTDQVYPNHYNVAAYVYIGERS